MNFLRIEQYQEELRYIEELGFASREEFIKTENAAIKFSENAFDRMEKTKIKRIENNQELKESEESLWETIARLGAEAAKKLVDAQKEAVEAITELLKDAADLLSEVFESKLSAIDQQISRQQMILDGAANREAELRRIAEERKLNADESIEAERDAQKKALSEIDRLEGKKRELEMIIAAMKLLADGKSVGDIKNSITSIKSFLSSEGSFIEGTKTTVGAALGHNNIKDGHTINVDDKEAIFNPSQTAALDIRPGGNTTQDVVDAFKHVQGIADTKLSSGISGSSFGENIYGSAILNQLIEMKHELKSLPDNMPESDLGFNAYVGALEFSRRTGMRKEKVRYNLRNK